MQHSSSPTSHTDHSTVFRVCPCILLMVVALAGTIYNAILFVSILCNYHSHFLLYLAEIKFVVILYVRQGHFVCKELIYGYSVNSMHSLLWVSHNECVRMLTQHYFAKCCSVGGLFLHNVLPWNNLCKNYIVLIRTVSEFRVRN